MRQIICIFSAFALLIGCVKIDPTTTTGQESEAVIAFDCPILGPKTKSVAEYADYPDHLDFNVLAFYSEDQQPEFGIKDAEQGELNNNRMLGKYIDDARFSKAEGSNVWEAFGDKKYYWPHSGYLHFVAYAPAEAKSHFTQVLVTNYGLLLRHYNVPDAANEDLMVSRFVLSQTRPNVQEEAVPLLFDHVLASLTFNVRSGIYGDRTVADPNRVDTDLRIKKIEVRGVYAEANFSQFMGLPPWDDEKVEGSSSWRWLDYDYNVVKNFTAFNGTSSKLTGDYQPIHDRVLSTDEEEYLSLTNLMLLPQDIEPSAVLRVTYDITHSNLDEINGGENVWVENLVKEVPLRDCGVLSWNCGHRYTYNLTLSLDRIECSTEVEEWYTTDFGTGLENLEVGDVIEL